MITIVKKRATLNPKIGASEEQSVIVVSGKFLSLQNSREHWEQLSIGNIPNIVPSLFLQLQ